MGAEYETPIRAVRDRLSDVVDQAGAGDITYVTRNGQRVAAIVPLDAIRARPAPEMLPSWATRSLPSAPGGRLNGIGDQIEEWERWSSSPRTAPGRPTFSQDWDRAALESIHLHLTEILAATAEWLGLTGQALGAMAEHQFGIAEELTAAMESAQRRLNAVIADPEEVYYELTEPDETTCATCLEVVRMYHGREGWQHSRTVDARPEFPGTKTELYMPDHPTEPVGWRARIRPAIQDGKLVREVRAGFHQPPAEEEVAPTREPAQ